MAKSIRILIPYEYRMKEDLSFRMLGPDPRCLGDFDVMNAGIGEKNAFMPWL
jgi:hypothetical protein